MFAYGVGLCRSFMEVSNSTFRANIPEESSLVVRLLREIPLAKRNSGRVRISGSVFRYNEGGAVGGAVFVWSDVDLWIVGCVFSDNRMCFFFRK